MPPIRIETSPFCSGMTTAGGWWPVVGKGELVVVTIRGGKSFWGKGERGHFDFVRFRAHYEWGKPLTLAKTCLPSKWFGGAR